MTGSDAFFETGGTVWFDISPFLERNWTGIPVVAAGLVASMLRRGGNQARLFLNWDEIDRNAVLDATDAATGLFLQRDIDCGRARIGAVPLLDKRDPRAFGLFPSVKPVRQLFPREANVVHDVSTLVLPTFHIRGNVLHHMESLMADLATNEFTVAVSEATKADLVSYLGVDAESILVAPAGATWPEDFDIAARNVLDLRRVEPYFLILGTREPRKNVTLVFDMLERHAELLQSYRFVFAGRMGWLEELHLLPPSLEAAVTSGRIVFTGFVTELQKYVLLRGAQATLFPSLFEGFGLPVLESLASGTPCVASWSSSIPEVGGPYCRYFDPLSADDLRQAIGELQRMRRQRGATLPAACRDWAQRFTWDAALDAILGRAAAVGRAGVMEQVQTSRGRRRLALDP